MKIRKIVANDYNLKRYEKFLNEIASSNYKFELVGKIENKFPSAHYYEYIYKTDAPLLYLFELEEKYKAYILKI